jgi:hypothetical protein
MKNGIYKLRVPIKYLANDAKQSDIEVLEALQKKVEEVIGSGEGAICLPAVRDENGNPLFDLEYVGP